MRASASKAAIYLVCFHSVEREPLRGCDGQYRTVETAIREGEWPYDNGDDPSFYVARHGGLLGWGVCRQPLRSAITKDSVVVFFSFTPQTKDRILYRLCAVETVTDKLDHGSIQRDGRFSRFRNLYINGLITRDGHGWRHGEEDRPCSHRHKDWLWRIADHRGMTHEEFDKKYASTYRCARFSDSDVVRGRLRLAGNYVVFSTPPDRAYISRDPPEVASAVQGQNEEWTNERLRTLTVGTAASMGARGYLRAANRSGRYVHRHIRFDMATEEVGRWRDELIAALREATEGRGKRKSRRARTAQAAQC